MILKEIINTGNFDKKASLGFGIITLLSIAATGISENTKFLFLPLLLVGIIIGILDYSIFYYLLLFTLPFSVNYPIAGGLTMDVPSEPLMLILMGCFILQLLTGGLKIDFKFIFHPIIAILACIFIWSVYTSFFSVDVVKSIKYILAKTWFIIPFVFISGNLFRKVKDIRKVILIAIAGIVVSVIIALFRHMLLGFGFDTANDSLKPFFMNHVIYATMVALFVPYVFYEIKLNSRIKANKILFIIIFALLVFAVIMSYTRASWLSLPIAAIYFFIIRFKLTAKILTVGYIAVALIAFYFINENTYLRYSPDYEKTIFNGQNIEKHLEATYKFEDVSGMERVYRWIAAIRMAEHHPILGSGPSTFYPEYRKYTVKSFATYVSDNPEKSTTHNYFLLQLAEQGIPGLILFLILITYTLILIEKLYHRTLNSEYRYLILGSGLSFVVIVFHLLLNELVEVDKIGSFFFISLAILIKLDIWTKNEESKIKNSLSELI